MIDIRMTDAERIEEVGQLLSLGAMRAIQEKSRKSGIKALDDGSKTRLTVRDGEEFAVEKPLPDAQARTSLN